MIEGRPSRTALGAAMRRASHQLIDRPLIFEDPLALRILPPEGIERVKKEAAGSLSLHSSPRLRAFLAMRARIAEDTMAEAFASGVRQYVILGAGLDTFAYRAGYRFPGLRVFEVDHPSTQQWKRGRLRAASIAAPSSLTYVPVDFGSQQFLDELARSGFNHRAPACFAWLGVSMYLPARDVLTTLRAVASCASGSAIVFDYMVPRKHLGLLARIVVWQGKRRVARQGEPWVSEFDPVTLANDLRGMGFGSVEDFGPAELFERFLAGRTDKLKGGSAGHVMLARV